MVVLACQLALTQRVTLGLLWFNDAPNNLGDFDGLTTASGEFFLRYNNGACAGGVGAAVAAGGAAITSIAELELLSLLAATCLEGLSFAVAVTLAARVPSVPWKEPLSSGARSL